MVATLNFFLVLKGKQIFSLATGICCMQMRLRPIYKVVIVVNSYNRHNFDDNYRPANLHYLSFSIYKLFNSDNVALFELLKSFPLSAGLQILIFYNSK